jgi:hypothetical protein
MLNEHEKPRGVRRSLLFGLILVSTLTVGVSVILAASLSRGTFSAPDAQLLQMLSILLSAAGLALAVAIALPYFRRLRGFDGLILVCAWTRRVQWQGRWISFEEYLARRFDLQCTHGISDEAAAAIQADALHTSARTDSRRTLPRA